MKRTIVILTSTLVGLFWAVGTTVSQVADPIPTPIPKRGLRVEIRDVARLPDTRKLRPAA
jgi:hypothetical protein